jgi:hypothetical protein
MLRTQLVRRAGLLLGAAAVSGVLSAGILAAAPGNASSPSSSHVSAGANGIKSWGHASHGYRVVTDWDANGI